MIIRKEQNVYGMTCYRHYFAVRVVIIYSSSLKLFISFLLLVRWSSVTLLDTTTLVSMNGGYVDIVLPFILKGQKNSQKTTLFTVIQHINHES